MYRPPSRLSSGASKVGVGRASGGTSAASSLRQTQAMLRRRVPVEAPAKMSSWEDELWKLQRLYSASGPFSADCEADSTCLRLTHFCTDPDWDAASWAPDGINLEINIPAGYPEGAATTPELRISGPSSLPPNLTKYVPLLFTEFASKGQPGVAVVYDALRYVDRHLVALWCKVRDGAEQEGDHGRPSTQAATHAVVDTSELEEVGAKLKELRVTEVVVWSKEEQARLEDALVEFRSVVDVKERWSSIAKVVGGCRSARDCAERYQVCRDAAGGKGDAASASSTVASSKEPTRPALGLGWSAEEVRRMGVEVRLLGANLEGVATLMLSKLRIQVVCDRCKKPLDLEAACRGTEPQSVETMCPVCKQQVGIRVAPAICHGGCAAVGHVQGTSCHPVQLLRSDFTASCMNCTQTMPALNVGPGYKKRSNCVGCHGKYNIVVEGADLIGTGIGHWRQIAADQGDTMTARRQLQDARKAERDLGIKVGTPLPGDGSCKHYKKSYRWMRFPCCGRAFPCDECHDEAMDHPHERANRMLCGHCSFEQAFSHDKCMNCGAASIRARSAYWEGGQGCRSRELMSASDSHKYKGLGKTTSRKKVTK